MINKDKFYGVLFGQAIGDALGLGTEFMTRKDIRDNYPNGLSDYKEIIQDDHRCRWKIGDWTDDTDMMMCIAESILENQGKVNLLSVASKFKEWFKGDPLGIGRHTFKVLCMRDFETDPQMVSEAVWMWSKQKSAANGGLMRTSVIGLLNDDVERHAADVCSITHYDPRCIGSCAIASQIIHNLVYANREMPFDEICNIALKYDNRIMPFIEKAREAQSLKEFDIDGLDMGYTLICLSVSLWSLWHCKSFEEGLLTIINEGGDADTNACVACAMLGAKFGLSDIPTRLISGLAQRTRLTETADRLFLILNASK